VANESKDGPINWRWLGICCAGGTILIALALFLQTEWGWSGVVTDILVEAGVAGVFVGVAFLFERAFVRKVKDAAASATEEIFATRIGDLTRAVRRLDDADIQTRNKLVTVLEDNPTLANFYAAMQEAVNVEGLAEKRIKVTASPDRDTLSLSFAQSKSDDKPAFKISIVPETKAKARLANPVSVTWTESNSAESIGHSISVEIQRNRLLNSPDDFDWDIALNNLKNSIDVAIKSRGSDANDWHLNGGLYELLGNGWAVSSAGLEHRERAYLLARRDLIFVGRPSLQPRRDLRPQWCIESDWKWLVERAKNVYLSS